VNRADKKRWATARTLADAGALTAFWLEGAITQTPGHAAPPCEETAELIPVLAAANRAGFVTDSSQPGRGSALQSGEFTRPGMQRAAVQGFADDDVLRRLQCATAETDLIFLAHRAKRRMNYRTAVTVTLDDGEPFTSFGATLSRRQIRFSYWACHEDAQDALCAAWQVTVIDPEWGRNDRLWPALAAFAGLVAAS
jgi:hypothetical protein